MATHSSILAWEIPCSGAPGWVRVRGVAKSRIQLSTTSTVEKVSFFEIVFQLWCLCFSCDSPGCINLYISGNVKSISYSGLQSKSVKENRCEWHILYGKDSSPLPPPQPSPAVLREHPISNIPSEWEGQWRGQCGHPPRAVIMWALDKYYFGFDCPRDPLLETESKGRLCPCTLRSRWKQRGTQHLLQSHKGNFPRAIRPTKSHAASLYFTEPDGR